MPRCLRCVAGVITMSGVRQTIKCKTVIHRFRRMTFDRTHDPLTIIMQIELSLDATSRAIGFWQQTTAPQMETAFEQVFF